MVITLLMEPIKMDVTVNDPCFNCKKNMKKTNELVFRKI